MLIWNEWFGMCLGLKLSAMLCKFSRYNLAPKMLEQKQLPRCCTSLPVQTRPRVVGVVGPKGTGGGVLLRQYSFYSVMAGSLLLLCGAYNGPKC